MPLNPGTRIGPYEVVAKLGEGGMGEVYRARDTKLNREVALKVLPASLGGDPDRLARFRREAQVLAALNHPNIAHIHGFEDSGDQHALVMELVEGPTLADRISHGPIALADALPIARQIAEGIEAAHEQGIIHRDLKPSNIKVREDGTVKVLDFGLAKAMGPESSGVSSGDAMNSPTLTARATQLGMIIGTAAYMAPEQAKGRQVDRRADIWAFGVILFEMLTGKRGYEAEDISETLAAVLTREVDWKALPAATPARLKALVRDCLVREPKQRLRDIGDARRAIEKMMEGGADEMAAATPAATRARTGMLPWIIAAAAIAIAALATAMALRPRAEPPQNVTRAEVHLKDFSGFIAISRDGTKVAYATASNANNAVLLSLRMLDQFEAKPIPGTDGGAWPVFSPDGQWIAFSEVSGPNIKKVPLTGGTATTVGDGGFSSGATWGDNDMIVFASSKGLMKVAGSGGKPEVLTTVDTAKGETGHSLPHFLPGSRQLIFSVGMKDQPPQIAVLDFATGKYVTVAKGGINSQYVTSGHLIYVRNSTIFAVPFDLPSLKTTGGEVNVVEAVSEGPAGGGDFAVAENGMLAYFASAQTGEGTTLAFSDRTGQMKPLPGQSTKQWGTGRISPDGRFIANVITNSNSGRDVWIFDIARGTSTRLTNGGNFDYPAWAADGRRIYFGGMLDGKWGVYRAPTDGSGKPELLFATQTNVQVNSIAPDGRTFVYTQTLPDKPPQLMVAELGADGTAGKQHPLRETTAAEVQGEISPDGRWLAYASTESGSPEIYVQPYPGGGAKIRISPEGGQRARWSRDGRELYYWAGTPTAKFMAVDIPNGDPSRAGTPKQLFTYLVGTTWDVTSDKNKFMVELTTSREGVRFATVTNWFEELKKRAPVRK
jgi:serine/threonine-protein kinase